MKEWFGKGFGFIAGLYAALVAIQVIDELIPDKYKLSKEKYSEKNTDFVEEA